MQIRRLIDKCCFRVRYPGVIWAIAIAVSAIGCGTSQRLHRYAIYKDFVVLGGGGGSLTAGLHGPIPSTIYVQVADGSAFALKELPEQIAARELEASDSTDIRPGDAMYRKSHTLLKFTQGELTYASLNYSWEGLKIGSNLKGPFYKFPLTREQIVELFGEPLEWRPAPKEPSGP